jgi:hypothetical protein
MKPTQNFTVLLPNFSLIFYEAQNEEDFVKNLNIQIFTFIFNLKNSQNFLRLKNSYRKIIFFYCLR